MAAGASEPITFSGPLFRLIAPPTYLHQHLTQPTPVRPCGRTPSESRPTTLTVGSLSHAHGSAVVRAGDTAAVCGVRGEVLTLEAGDDPSSFETYRKGRRAGAGVRVGGSTASSGGAGWGGLIVPNIEMSTGCSKNYPLGPPGDFAQMLAQRINDLIEATKIVDLKSLRIYKDDGSASGETATAATAAEGEAMDTSDGQGNEEKEIKGYWTLYLDVLCISLDGNILDVAWTAIIAALATTRLPKAVWDVDVSKIICSAAQHEQQRIKLRKNLPFTVTFAGVTVPHIPPTEADKNGSENSSPSSKTFLLNDPDAFEETEANESLTITLSVSTGRAHRAERMEKVGGRNIGLSEIKSCIDISVDKVQAMTDMISKEVEKQELHSPTSAGAIKS